MNTNLIQQNPDKTIDTLENIDTSSIDFESLKRVIEENFKKIDKSIEELKTVKQGKRI